VKICSSGRTARWRLVVRRGHRVTNLRASFEGVRAPVRTGTRRGRQFFVVQIDMSGLQRGIYVARVRYRIDGRRSTQIPCSRACGGTPKGGLREGPTRLEVTVI